MWGGRGGVVSVLGRACGFCGFDGGRDGDRDGLCGFDGGMNGDGGGDGMCKWRLWRNVVELFIGIFK